MQPTQAQDFTQAGEVLAVSLELAVKGWKVGCTTAGARSRWCAGWRVRWRGSA